MRARCADIGRTVLVNVEVVLALLVLGEEEAGHIGINLHLRAVVLNDKSAL